MIRRSLASALPREVLLDVLTIVTELVNNAAQHGDGEEIRVRLEVERSGRILGEVASNGGGEVKPRKPDATGGLGLRLVDNLATSWRVVSDGMTTVQFELRPGL